MLKLIDRECFEVVAKVIDASGGFNNLSYKDANNNTITYPQSFDSRQNNDDVEQARLRAYESFDRAGSEGYKAARSGRPLTIVTITRVSDGKQLDKKVIGKMPQIEVEVPDEEPEEPVVEPEEPEQNGGE